jgi:hypothetical protein
MEQMIRDLMMRVQGLRERVGEQSTQASKDQLNALHIALKALLQRAQSSPERKGVVVAGVQTRPPRTPT